MANRKSDEQRAEAIYLMNMPNENGVMRTNKEVAEALGVDVRTLYNWRKEPTFSQMVMDAGFRNTIVDRIPDIVNALIDSAVNDGNAAAGRTLLQAAGQLDSKQTIEVTHKNDDANDIRKAIEELRGRTVAVPVEDTHDIIEMSAEDHE